MRQTQLFVPARLVIAALAIALMAVASPKASVNIIYASDITEKPAIDPIITGQTISSDQLEDWKAKRNRFEECGLCGDEQPFPSDIAE